MKISAHSRHFFCDTCGRECLYSSRFGWLHAAPEVGDLSHKARAISVPGERVLEAMGMSNFSFGDEGGSVNFV